MGGDPPQDLPQWVQVWEILVPALAKENLRPSRFNTKFDLVGLKVSLPKVGS
jgi:hypothetical protein